MKKCPDDGNQGQKHVYGQNYVINLVMRAVALYKICKTVLVRQFDPTVVPLRSFGNKYGYYYLGVEKNKRYEPDMLGLDIAYLKNTLKHKKREKGSAEICEFSGEERFKSGA